VNSTYRALVVGFSDDELARLRPHVEKLYLDASYCTSTQQARHVVFERFYQVILIRMPDHTPSFVQLVEAIRDTSSLCSNAGVCVLAPPKLLGEATRLLGRGVNRALSLAESPQLLACTLTALVAAQSPLAQRRDACVDLMLQRDDQALQWQTRNLSVTGMLAYGAEHVEVGDRYRFQLALPVGAVEGEAEVVRQTAPGREDVIGYGLRFCSLQHDGRRRLSSFLRSFNH